MRYRSKFRSSLSSALRQRLRLCDWCTICCTGLRIGQRRQTAPSQCKIWIRLHFAKAASSGGAFVLSIADYISPFECSASVELVSVILSKPSMTHFLGFCLSPGMMSQVFIAVVHRALRTWPEQSRLTAGWRLTSAQRAARIQLAARTSHMSHHSFSLYKQQNNGYVFVFIAGLRWWVVILAGISRFRLEVQL